jgi:prefoldin subunit 5
MSNTAEVEELRMRIQELEYEVALIKEMLLVLKSLLEECKEVNDRLYAMFRTCG